MAKSNKSKISLRVTQTIELESAFEEFIRFSKAKNLSASTIRNYQREFKAFNQWYDGDLQGVTASTVLAYTEYLQDRNIAIASVNTALRVLRVVLNYWLEQGYIKSVKVKLQRANEQIKDTYTDAEITKLLKKPNIKKCSFPEYRTWVIINFLVGTGCRLGTLVSVRIADIDFENQLIQYTHTKNRKAQFIPLSRQLGEVLQQYLRYRGGEPEELLFPSENNTKLLTTSIAHDVAKFNRSRGVQKTSCHLYRHSYAKNFILQGGDPFRLQKILGHSTLAMSQKYSNLYGTDLKHNFDQFDLLSRLKVDKISLGGRK